MVLNDDQRALQQAARRFARERLLPQYQKREETGILDRDLIREMGRLGLLGADLPEEFGGLGADAVTTGLIAEELAYGDFNISAVPVGISLNGAILMRNAQPEVIAQWAARMTRGEAVVAICVTEPRGGSDAANLQLRARREGDHYVLNGEKTSITFADCADAYLVFARTGRPEDGAKGVTALFRAGRCRHPVLALQRRGQPHHRPRGGVLRRCPRAGEPPTGRRGQGFHASHGGLRLQPGSHRASVCRRRTGFAR
jgi:cyclohexanecarboxyl-CoA dehydrogenase